MLTLVKTISTQITNLIRTVKVSRYGKDDTVTGMEAMPYGDDSNPIAGMDAVYLELSSRKNKVIVGYINKQQLADIGEKRIYSTDANGNVQFYIWLHADGTCDFGGNANHLAQYEALATAFNELQTKFNNFAAAYTPGSPTSVGTPPTIAQSTADITEAKLTNHLCP